MLLIPYIASYTTVVVPGYTEYNGFYVIRKSFITKLLLFQKLKLLKSMKLKTFSSSCILYRSFHIISALFSKPIIRTSLLHVCKIDPQRWQNYKSMLCFPPRKQYDRSTMDIRLSLPPSLQKPRHPLCVTLQANYDCDLLLLNQHDIFKSYC